MTYYYLLCSYILKAGSVVEPGNWGRMLMLYPPGQGRERIDGEQTIEKIRAKFYENRPSRLNALFLCETLDEARAFQKTTNRIFDIVYRVRLMDSSSVVFRADWSKIQINNGESLQSQEDRAREYWEGTNINNPEILTLSQAEIIEIVG